jgi:hypothetical protein
MKAKEKIVPQQREGGEKNIDHTLAAIDENDAKKLFMIARNRLMDVNHWHEYASPITANFHLTDPQGHEVNRAAEKGDYFKINLPGPSRSEGEGEDWVRIEAIEETGNPDGYEESIAIRVRPAPDPRERGENVAHFFSDSATSSFVIERNAEKVTAAVYGRNEATNTKTTNIIDKVRNTVVGMSAKMGFSDVQWKNLVKGLLNNNKNTA